MVGDTKDGAVCIWAGEHGGAVVWVSDEPTAVNADVLDQLGVRVLVRCIDGHALQNIKGVYQVSGAVFSQCYGIQGSPFITREHILPVIYNAMSQARVASILVPKHS